MDSIASRLAALPQEKRELLLRQFHQRKNSVQGQIEPQKRDTHLLPLSFAQQRLWFLDQLEPGNISYNMSGAVRMRGTLYIRALEQSMQAVVARHETLRTTFVMVQDQPWQNITPSLMLPLPVVDLRLLSDPIREEMALHTARAESQKAFDLACGPLLRVTLLQLGEDDYVLCVTMHHIVSDGWSLSIFLRELCSFYASIVENAPITLNDLPIQYSDFAIWQRQLLQGEILEKHEMYWRKQLAALPDTLDLPTDHPRPTLPSYRGARRPIRVPKPMLDELKMLGQREGATLFMTLLAALQVLLYRYTYQEDIVVGTPIANRTRKEIEGLIGFFVNTLVLRTNLSGKPIFYELLRRVRDMTLDAYTHQDLPFEYLVDMLQPERDMSRSVLFQVMFSMQNTPPIKAEFAHLELQEMGIEDTTAKFDLTLLIQDTEQDLLGSWVYSTDLFDESTIDRLNEHFQSLLEAIIQHPDRPITAYTLISQQERDKLLFAFNGPQPRFSTQTLVHERFEAQALHTPDTVALVFEDQHMTYAELDRRANQLAHYLQGLGVGPQVPVGLCMERSLTLIIGLLGILKAGGAYVPLDPTYPQQRLAFLLQDAQMPVVLTQQHLNERLSLQQDKVDVVCLDTEWSLIETMAVEKPQGAVSESLMYIIYTSGSTGVPKGVQVSHANVVRLFAATEEEFDFDSHDCWTLFHSYAFDFSVWELWGALLYGGRLVVVPYNISRSSSDLYQLLYEQGVTVLNQTPSAFWHFLQIEERHTRPEALALRLVIFGGEALSPQRLRSWSERHGLACPRMVNMYGITETTVHVTAHTLVDADVTGSGGSVAGSALADLQVYILDEQQQPVPIGITGEIYVGGAGLAWGYLNWPDLTAERFVPHPWSQEPGARLYKSGDLARYRADGVLEYLGRRDQQVKVRGHRIELGEIEAHLHEHPSIADCVVQIGEGYQGEKLLIAYVVIQKQEVFRADELRVYLRAKLPDYMVPAIYVQLETLPLTSNGKVDRRALPVPQPQSADVPSRDTGYPGTPLEEMVGNVWAQVLKLDQVHPGDDFFALGGHSLFATQVISRLNTLLGVDIPLRSIFEHSTVTALARHIEHLLLRKQGMDIPPLVSISREQELPLSFAQQRLWFLDQFVPDNPFYNISVAIRLEGKLQLQALEQSLNEITQRHEALRTTFINENGTPRQIITPKVSIPLPVVDLVWLSGEERDVICKVLLHQESQRPFDLVHGPLLRAGILRLEPGKQILQLTMHHIVSDGWSMGVFVRELMACYAHFAFGASLSLPELTIQYADFAIWQREWLQGEVLEQHLSYWKQQLEQAPALLEIPTDRPRPAVQSYRGGHYSFLLPLSLRENLKELSQREGVTFFMTLLAVFKTLLYRYTEQEDIVVGTPIANRRQTQIENLIGFFVNMLVLRTNLAGNPTFLELLGRVRETALDAYAHQDLPFEQLVDALHPEREMSHAPLFQVLFVLQNIPMLEATFENVTLSQMELDNDTSKYDLALFMGECKDGLLGTIEYSTDLFDTETIARMVLHFKTLLEAVLANPLQRVMDLPLLTSAEKQQVLLDWNATQSDYLRDTGLQHLFEKQAKRTPDVVAIAFEDQQITYAELDHLANQLATALQGLGVGQESLVGLCMERSIELLIGMLGILKAGGAYVPLDPTYPQARLAFMLQDSKATVLVTQHHLIQDLPTQNLRLLCVSAETFAHDVEPNLPVMFSSEQAAYVIYTSGSTGKPKGTVISHRAVINFFASMCREPGIRSSDRILAVTSLSFDIAALELLLPLTIGACINLASRQVTTDGAALAKLLGTSGATLLQATPSTWRMLIGSGWAGSPHLKMLCGGEALPEELAAQLLSCGEELWNMYGPTETTIWSAICQIAREHEPITIGRPIDNTQLYVLDVTGTPVPIGVAGELYIGGDGIARGYWQRPELSADRFVPDPFCMRSGARMYRTGDKVRWLASGTLEYLGRMDQQVKLRGYRIELGEIEEVLRQVPYVKEGVVLVREDTPGEMRLIAYIVPNPEEQELEAGSDQWKDEHVEQWQLLWSETYRATGYLEDRTFNITGWNSSYTGLPIPAQEMREQVEQAVARILVRRPQKVLEIGCGTGLLLFRIAPFCAEYHASDFSSDALQYVQQVLSMRSLPQVRLALQSAQEALNVQEGTFDAVILNSVVQYFPDIHYLVQVLEGCIAALRPGGFLFIGDVRCLPLLRAYATSVELYQADSSLSRSELRRRVQQRVVEEEELLIDPAFFYALQQSLPHIGQVQVLLKRGDAENELTRFRYDIVVRKEATEEAGATQIVWQWGRESIDLSSIEQ
ncbi:MAG TPA: amino acid adenylation domain-containing protein, partial [Ktedonobacteraceae bacterium]|nr:amino acid adenylation domain-containing protein [Ktedonobacteraceae bacterium]